MSTSHSNLPQRRTVFITSAAHGIGLALATALAAHPDYHILLGTRSLARAAAALQPLASTSPSAARRISLVEIDISSDSSIAAAAATIAATHGAIDILVNNAGVFPDAASSAAGADDDAKPTMTPAQRARLTQSFENNVLGSTLVTEMCLPLLRQSRDARRQIIFLSSAAGTTGSDRCDYPSAGADGRSCDRAECTRGPASQSGLVHGYAMLTRLARHDEASTAALGMIMQCYAMKLQGEGIVVNAVCVGGGGVGSGAGVGMGGRGRKEQLHSVADGVRRLVELIAEGRGADAKTAEPTWRGQRVRVS